MSEGNLLSEEITQRLLHEIREGCYANCRKLPPELTLAKEMGVSRIWPGNILCLPGSLHSPMV